ncbi:MAG TPA: PEGA domain-containing protein [Kofleriaceae bacterium]|nr:PEGA domain-containing protein [Kofleriaceae bacterium]
MSGATIAHAAPAIARPAPAAAGKPAHSPVADVDGAIRAGKYTEALARIEQVFAGASRAEQSLLLERKGRLLMGQRDIAGAIAAFEAYLETGVRGANAVEVAKILRNLKLAPPLKITVSNGPADIYLDNKASGVFCAQTTACEKKVMPTPHRVIVERPGFAPRHEAITVRANQPATLDVALVELPSRVTVHVTPATAEVTLDDQPFAAPADVAAGDHRVVAHLDHFVDARAELTAHEGKPVELALTLVPLVPVEVAPATATLVLDGQPAAPTAGRLPLPPGAHRLIARAPGYQERAVDIPAELPADYRISVQLAHDVVAPPAHWFTFRRKLAVASGALALAGVGVGAVLGVQARNADHDAFALCPSPTTPCRDAARANALNQRGQSRATDANVAFGLAGAAAVGAAVLWMVGAPESRVVVAPRVGGSVAAIDLGLAF